MERNKVTLKSCLNNRRKKLDMIVSKIIMYEHHTGIEDVIEDIISI
jgi:hypothetical protein